MRAMEPAFKILKATVLLLEMFLRHFTDRKLEIFPSHLDSDRIKNRAKLNKGQMHNDTSH